VFFRPLAAALRETARDDLGKEAVKVGLKAVAYTYNPDTAPLSNYVGGVSFADGVLTVNFAPGVNAREEDVADLHGRSAAIREVLEANI